MRTTKKQLLSELNRFGRNFKAPAGQRWSLEVNNYGMASHYQLVLEDEKELTTSNVGRVFIGRVNMFDGLRLANDAREREA